MSELTMYDSVTVANIPRDAVAVAGYVGGRYPTYQQLLEQFPHAHHLPIAVTASEDAHCLDVEAGDATPEEAPAWVHRQHERGLKRPVLYAQVSNMQALVDTLEKDNVKREDVLLWTAHYTDNRHFCGPHCGFGMKVTADGTQYATTAKLDTSVVTTAFWT